MAEFELGEHTYRVGRLDAFKQFHLSRKIAPIIPTLIPAFLTLHDLSREGAASSDPALMAEAFGPFAAGIAGMPDEAAEFILGTCLSVVQRRQGNVWMPVWSVPSATCMFDDIDLVQMVQISARVMEGSLGPFLRGLLANPTHAESA
jgi:hypothetical protein